MPGPEGATAYRSAPPIDASRSLPPSSPQAPETIRPIPTFGLEEAGLCIMFLDREEDDIKRYGATPLKPDTVDMIYDTTQDQVRSNPSNKGIIERQAGALEALGEISGLPDEKYSRWITGKPKAIQTLTGFGRNLRGTVISYGDQPNDTVLGEMIRRAKEKYEKTIESDKREREIKKSVGRT